jgi:hypothetical protein
VTDKPEGVQLPHGNSVLEIPFCDQCKEAQNVDTVTISRSKDLRI